MACQGSFSRNNEPECPKLLPIKKNIDNYSSKKEISREKVFEIFIAYTTCPN